MQKVKYSIILPVYKQEAEIRSIVSEHQRQLAQCSWSHEMILVVNGNADGSLDVCRQLSKEYPSVKVVHTPEKGWGLAVRLGLKEVQGEFVCFTNSSRTQTSDLIKCLNFSKDNPAYVVKANRKVRESLSRKLGSFLYNLECRALFGIDYRDINGTPKIFPRKCDALLNLIRDDDLLDLEFLIVCKKNDYPILNVPVFSFKRIGGRSTTGYRTALRLYSGAFKLWLAKNRVTS